MSYRENSNNFFNQRFDRISSKRKLDDYGTDDDDDFSDLVSVRMKTDEPDAVNNFSGDDESDHGDDSVAGARVSDARLASCSSSTGGDFGKTNSRLQFFVKTISGGNTIVIHANPEDSVESVHERIQILTGIPIAEQRLIYRGKQLQWEQSLAECSIQNDAGLQLVGRMRSTEYPKTWQIINDMVSSICRLCRGDSLRSSRTVKSRVKDFLKMTPTEWELAWGHLQIFKSSGAPTALVMLFLSPVKDNNECAEESIRLFLTPNLDDFPNPVQTQCAPIVLEFCKLLRKYVREDPLYISCRNTLASLLETIGNVHGSKYFDYAKASYVVQEFFPFVSELANKLSLGLQSSLNSPPCVGPLASEVRDFAAFLLPLRGAIEDVAGFDSSISIPLCCVYEIVSLHEIFTDLLEKIDECLKKMDESLAVKGIGESESVQPWWSQYLAILKELNGISKFFQDASAKLCSILRLRKCSLNALIIRCATRRDDHRWLLEHKDVTNFESRRHLVMMMLPDMKEEYEEMHEMLIDRSQLLSESFEYIARADAEALHGGIFMEFKNEEATGPGVLREWFFLVFQAMFNPQHALFVACPNDRRRFFPNPASNVNPLHLEYFGFCGRVVALALMHKVQIGIVFDRIFFLQLAGDDVSLEDVHDADPYLYGSCKKILEMDADFVDSDALGLTFVREIEELGSRKVVELCPGGKSIIVNSRNREEYVNLLIQHCFVTSIAEQVAHFAQGFADVLCDSRLQKFFFKSLDLEDLDRMLDGSGIDISVTDWKAHTEYIGYKESDKQICWFWKIVEGMSTDQRRVLLFFWTSVRYLPVEGFGGLNSRLSILKASGFHDGRLPVSHTCFHRLCLPAYSSIATMQECLHIITQEHVSCSFGIW